MEKRTKDFLNKVKINTYIYTFTFMAVGVWYSMKHSMGTEPMMLLLATFAFYTLGRQVRLVADLEAGAKVDTQPKAPAWVRGVTYLIVMLLVLSVMFS